MRLFVAAPVPAEVRDALAPSLSAHRHDRRMRWADPVGWHCTLAFVGEAEDPAPVVAATRDGVARVDVGPVTLTTGEVHTLARRTALVVELADDPDGALARLGDAVQRALVDAEVDVHVRRVQPHVTLGRSRGDRRVPRELVDDVELPATAWTMTGIEVVQSILGRGPARYATVATVPLVG